MGGTMIVELSCSRVRTAEMWHYGTGVQRGTKVGGTMIVELSCSR